MTNNKDPFDTWTREDEAGCWLGFAMIILAICSCGSTSKMANHKKKPESSPITIEQRENPATNRLNYVTRFYQRTSM